MKLNIIPQRVPLFFIYLISIGFFILLDYKYSIVGLFGPSILNLISLGLITVFNIIGASFILTKKRNPIDIANTIGIIWMFLVAIYIIIDKSEIYTRLGLDKELAFYFLSGILQGFAALLAIIGAFLVLKFDNVDVDDLLNLIYPAIFFFAVVLILSIVFLPLSAALETERYVSFLATIIATIVFFGVIATSWLCYALHAVYKK
jgi:hypothetical protein